MQARPLVTLLMWLAFAVFCDRASAGGRYTVGTLHSPKGFGLCASVQRGPDDFHSFLVYADITGLPLGAYADGRPGIKASYFHPHILHSWGSADRPLELYLGPGGTLGYVRDLGESHFGACMALSCCYGLRWSCRHRLQLTAGWSTELGLHLTRHDERNATTVSLYRNGLFQFFFPQLHIEYAF